MGALPLASQPKGDAPKEEEAAAYLLWDGAEGDEADKTGAGLARIAAPKLPLPGHEESYNPPAEFLPTEEARFVRDIVRDIVREWAGVPPGRLARLRAAG